MSSSPIEPPVERQDQAVVEAILSRISPSSISSETLSTLLQRRAEPKSHPQVHESSSSLPHHIALSLLTPIVRELESTPNARVSASGPGSPPLKDIPLAVLSLDEWRSLVRVCVRTCVAFYVFDIMTMRNTSSHMTIPTLPK